jgi:hypothetical protein
MAVGVGRLWMHLLQWGRPGKPRPTVEAKRARRRRAQVDWGFTRALYNMRRCRKDTLGATLVGTRQQTAQHQSRFQALNAGRKARIVRATTRSPTKKCSSRRRSPKLPRRNHSTRRTLGVCARPSMRMKKLPKLPRSMVTTGSRRL